MKQFLKQIIIYGTILFLLLFVFEIVTANIMVSNSNFKLESKPKYLVIGHSHAEMTFNDSLIFNLKNLAESGEAYFYTYYKIKNVLRKNPSIETVYLEFSNNNIDKKMDTWISGEVYMSYRLEKFAPLIDLKGKAFLLFENPLCYLKSLVVISKERIHQIWERNLCYTKKIGGYKKFDKSGEVNSNQISDIDRMPNDLKDYEVSKENLGYLHNIVKFCEIQGVKIVLIRSPQRSDYEFWGNEKYFKEILKEEFGNIDFIDFSRFNLKDDEYLNAAHLNAKGATRFSVWFNEMLTSGMMKKENREALNNIMDQTQH